MICICDKRIPPASLDSLYKIADEVFLLEPDSSLPLPISSHADLLLFVTQKHIIARADYYETQKAKIDEICRFCGRSIRISDSKAGDIYPLDCAFCAFVSGGHLFCREASTDKDILECASLEGLRIVNVNQGYAKCSTAVLHDGALITSDVSIARVAEDNGIDHLLIRPGFIDLPGYDYGFIGGCCGVWEDVLYFVGDVEAHPDYDSIFSFCQKHSTSAVSLSKDKLYDVGTLIFI